MKKRVSSFLVIGFMTLSSLTVAVAVGCTCGPDPVPVPKPTQGGLAFAADYNGAPFTWDRYNTPVITFTTNGSTTTATVTYLNKSGTGGGTVAGASKFKFNKDLYVWSSKNKINPDIVELQKILVAENLLGPTSQTGIYDETTKVAVVTFQKKYGIKPAPIYSYGYFGPITRVFVNSR